MTGLKREQAMPKGGEYEKDGIGGRDDFPLCFRHALRCKRRQVFPMDF
jgi:hypothetical protein